MLKKQGNKFLQQSFYVLLAFSMMVFLSYYLVSKIVRENLVKNSQNILNIMSEQFHSDLLIPKLTLINFSQTIRSMMLSGENLETIREYFNVIDSSIIKFQQYDVNYGFLGYFEGIDKEPVVIEDLVWEKPENYEPTNRYWYKNAVAANGEIAQSVVYQDMALGRTDLTYSICIFDDDGKQLGVVAIRIHVEEIGTKIVDITASQGGYGVLISDDLRIISHSNPNFIGKYVENTEIPFSILINNLKSGLNVSEHPILNFKGEKSVIFLEKQQDGWYIGCVVPKAPYYESVRNMAFILVALGIIFAASLIIILFGIDAAKNKSDKENKYKSAFLANMSHELRTPLNAVIGMTTIGKNAGNLEKKNYCFAKIENASKHLLGIISDILDLSKISENKFELSDIEFCFEKTLQRITDFISFKVSEKQQEFTVKIDEKIPKMLIGDDQRLAQVITNLLSNAVKFTPEGGTIELEARLLGEKDGISEIQIDVIDNGIGISPQNQAHLFQPFEQGDANTTRKFGGTGLGLSISKTITELMGGKIWVKSEFRNGSTFSFTFKMKQSKTNDECFPDINRKDWEKLKILVVDDNREVLDYFREILGKISIKCDIAESAKEALDTVREKGTYNIYFVDWDMPKTNGIELTEKLKNEGYIDTENSVVIMISAANLSNVEETAKKAGITKFLSKPLFPSDIIDILSQFVGVENQIMKAEAQKSYDDIFEKYHILIAEDMKINCEILSALFEPTKLKIDFVGTGIEATEKFESFPDKYDLILMDIQMPEMDGYQATQRIRAMNYEKAKTIPIIAMTANVFKEDIDRCIQAGMNDHVGKPIDFDLVMEKMRKYLLEKK